MVALVVTIVVLLILAGVSISLVVGENGIVKYAQNAKSNTQAASTAENTMMKNAINYMDTIH